MRKTGEAPGYKLTDSEQRIVFLIGECLGRAYRHVKSVMSEDYIAYPAANDRLDFTFAKENLFAVQYLWKLLRTADFSHDYSPVQKYLIEAFPIIFSDLGSIERDDLDKAYEELKRLNKMISRDVVEDLIN